MQTYPTLDAWYGSCSSGRDFASSFLQIPPPNGHPCIQLAVGNCQTPQRTFTAKIRMGGAQNKRGTLRKSA